MNVTDGEFFFFLRELEIVGEKATSYYVKLSIFVLKREKYSVYGLLQERRLFQSMKRRHGLTPEKRVSLKILLIRLRSYKRREVYQRELTN